METFELRRYDPVTLSNFSVGPFLCIKERCYRFDLTATTKENEIGTIFQVYPNDPTRCFYRPIPAGLSWYVIGGDTDQLLASIDSHDQYAFFQIPSSNSKQLHWVMAANFQEAIALIK